MVYGSAKRKLIAITNAGAAAVTNSAGANANGAAKPAAPATKKRKSDGNLKSDNTPTGGTNADDDNDDLADVDTPTKPKTKRPRKPAAPKKSKAKSADGVDDEEVANLEAEDQARKELEKVAAQAEKELFESVNGIF